MSTWPLLLWTQCWQVSQGPEAPLALQVGTRAWHRLAWIGCPLLGLACAKGPRGVWWGPMALAGCWRLGLPCPAGWPEVRPLTSGWQLPCGTRHVSARTRPAAHVKHLRAALGWAGVGEAPEQGEAWARGSHRVSTGGSGSRRAGPCERQEALGKGMVQGLDRAGSPGPGLTPALQGPSLEGREGGGRGQPAALPALYG